MTASARLPRGIRNHNPGNIERGDDKWQGMAADQSADDRFVVFASPEWGIRALARIPIRDQDHHGLDTVAGLIHRWAPPTGNRTGACVDHVADAVDVDRDQRIDVRTYAHMRPLVEAIIRHENGVQPYTAARIDRGLAAGHCTRCRWPLRGCAARGGN